MDFPIYVNNKVMVSELPFDFKMSMAASRFDINPESKKPTVIFKSKQYNDEKNIIKNADNFDQFKFTFTKNDKGNYVFKSLEKVK